MLRRSFPIAAAALAVLGATACSPVGSGSPEPTGTGQQTSRSAPEPAIENPKDIKAVTDSCSLLTAKQLAKLGMKAEPEHKDSRLGQPACDWSGDEFAITITPDTRSGGIDQLYKNVQGVKKSTVSGYPAAWIDKTSILCRVEVGVSKDAMVGISYTANVGTEEASKGQVEPCKQGERIAAMVLKNIPDA